MIPEQEIEIIKTLIQKAMEGTLSRDEFYNDWQESWDENEYLQKVFVNIESAVEHLPDNIFTGKPNLKIWKERFEYKELGVDYKLVSEINTLSILQIYKRRYDMLRKLR